MIFRYAFSIVIGACVTSCLLFVMQLMIATGQAAYTESQAYRIGNFVRVERNEVVETKEVKPERPPEPEQRPDTPTPEYSDAFDNSMAVSVAAPAMEASLSLGKVGFGVSDGEYLPIVKVAPVYPARALARKLEGHVLLEFVVTRTGVVRDVKVIESTAPLFERPAIEAALKFRYKPRVIDGEAVEVAGVRNMITFTMAG
ncbi:MAG TPA: TonB family protein [Gammaproteobacteria bacterium]|jgi:protein TonB